MTPQARRKFTRALHVFLNIEKLRYGYPAIENNSASIRFAIKARKQLYAVVDELATSDRKKFLDVLERLGNSPTARIDARKWAEYFREQTKKRQ